MIKRFIKKSSALIPHIIMSVGLILSVPVDAQTNRSDAGEILRQIERDRDLEKYNAPRTPPQIEEEKKVEIKKRKKKLRTTVRFQKIFKQK